MGLGKNNCYSILNPLSMQEDVSQIHVVRDSEGPEIPKVRYHVVPESIRKYSRLKVFYRLLLGFFLLTQKNFDFILSTYIKPHFFLSLILSTVFRKKRVHILINEAETCLHITNLWLECRLERFLVECLNRNTLTLVRSHKMINLFAGKGLERDKLMHLPHFLDMNRFSNQHGEREYDVVVTCRMEPVKRLDRLLAVISEIRKTKPNISVAIVGTGSLEDEVKQLTESKNLSENIEFMGFIPSDRIPDVWNKGKIYIITSENEGGPLTLFEAMACGVVPVATRVGNAPDLIRHGINGYLVGDPDDISEYTGYLLELLNNQGKLGRMSCEAEKIRENYDLSRSMEKWRTILSKIK